MCEWEGQGIHSIPYFVDASSCTRNVEDTAVVWGKERVGVEGKRRHCQYCTLYMKSYHASLSSWKSVEAGFHLHCLQTTELIQGTIANSNTYKLTCIVPREVHGPSLNCESLREPQGQGRKFAYPATETQNTQEDTPVQSQPTEGLMLSADSP